MESLSFDNHNTLDRHSPVPLYQQLCNVLSEQILSGYLKPGDALPSENELRVNYEISRYVVRQALDQLSRQGLIIKQQGRGSFVRPGRVEKPLDMLQSYHKSMQKSGLPVEVRIVTKTMKAPPEEIADQMGMAPGEKAFFLERVAYLYGAPVNILISYIAPGNYPWEYLLKFEGGSLYQHLEKVCGVCLHRSRSYLEVAFAGEYESRMLAMPRGSVLLQIMGTVFDREGKVVEYSRVVYQGAVFRFWFDSHYYEDAR